MNESIYFFFFLLQTYFIFSLYQQKKTVLKANKKTLSELKNYIAKYSNISKEYSDLTNNHMRLLQSTNADISSLKLQINKKNIELNELQNSFNKIQTTHQLDLKEKIKQAREDTIKRSRSVLRGQASEHLAPFVIKDTNPKDYRFMGNPVDYICFEGLSDLLDSQTNEITSVKFVDIKTGKSNLNKSQRRIRDAIKNGRVSFEVINLDEVINDNSTTKDETESKKEGKD
jgi:predicted Holliday junction resolvase-like endonuclease